MKTASAVRPLTARTRYISRAPTSVSTTAPPITTKPAQRHGARRARWPRRALAAPMRSDCVGIASGASSGSARNVVGCPVRLSIGRSMSRSAAFRRPSAWHAFRSASRLPCRSSKLSRQPPVAGLGSTTAFSMLALAGADVDRRAACRFAGPSATPPTKSMTNCRFFWSHDRPQRVSTTCASGDDDGRRPAPVQPIVQDVFALRLQRIVRPPERDDVVVDLAVAGDFHQLDDALAPVADRLDPERRALFVMRLQVLVVGEGRARAAAGRSRAGWCR